MRGKDELSERQYIRDPLMNDTAAAATGGAMHGRYLRGSCAMHGCQVDFSSDSETDRESTLTAAAAASVNKTDRPRVLVYSSRGVLSSRPYSLQGC